MKIVMIQRAPQFSPHSVEKDKAILDAVAAQRQQHGDSVAYLVEGEPLPVADAVFTMGRLPETLDALKKLQGVRIVNSPQGIENCARCHLETIMKQIGIPMPPKDGPDGYWLKRGDFAAQSKEDVIFVSNKTELEQQIEAMRQRGITAYTVSAHVKGDLVKFYGVLGTGFFRYYYPTDDGVSKFGDEQHNGASHHYKFDVDSLQKQVETLSSAVGISVYGGDCIVRADGSWCIIDFNDWPSFSRCREEAAKAISTLL